MRWESMRMEALVEDFRKAGCMTWYDHGVSWRCSSPQPIAHTTNLEVMRDGAASGRDDLFVHTIHIKKRRRSTYFRGKVSRLME